MTVAEEALNHPYFDSLREKGVAKNEVVKSKTCLRGNNNLLSGLLAPPQIHPKHNRTKLARRQEEGKLPENVDRIRVSTKLPKGESDKPPSTFPQPLELLINRISKLPSKIMIKNSHITQLIQGHPMQTKGNYVHSYNWNVSGSTDYSYNIELARPARVR